MTLNSSTDRKAYYKEWYRKNKERHGVKNQAWYAANKHKRNKSSLAWHKKYPERSKELQLRRYGLTLEQYEAMLAEQGGTCKICKRSENTKTAKRLSVDHCHVTGKIRGLLCRNCNAAVGMLKEDIDAAKNLVHYLIITKEK